MRKFLSILLTCMLTFVSHSGDAVSQMKEVIIPNALKSGDKICILEPARTIACREKELNKRMHLVVERLQKRGFIVVVYKDSFESSPLGLGDTTEQKRADAFNKAMNDPEIKAIFCFWGGYGAMHILDKIDYDAVRENRKIFVGFSDETAIELAIFEKSGLVTFHGPMPGATLNYQETKTFDALFDMLMNPHSQTILKNIDDNSSFKVHKSGTATGEILGGNLCLLQCLMGTPYMPKLDGKILFFEEIDENAYKIHRTLWQLKLAGELDKVAGIVIGKIIPASRETETDILKACFDVFKELNVPIIYNVHAGHIKNPLTIPVGAKAMIADDKLIIMQSAVT